MDLLSNEIAKTAFQKKTVSRLKPNEVLDLAISFFQERAYRAGRTGRPNQVFVMGGREGAVPRVTAEISARPDVGKPGTTLVTIDGFGELLGAELKRFHAELRARSRASTAAASPPESTTAE